MWLLHKVDGEMILHLRGKEGTEQTIGMLLIYYTVDKKVFMGGS